uniref:Pre-mRNA-processing factor 39 n=1 Tax=Malurus cyaneus samueli TaxID=2593467 RepID=A0A8C5TMS3_9PASS
MPFYPTSPEGNGRSLNKIPNYISSVDLWIHYINFLKETLDPADPETNSTIRGAYEHAVLAAGTDFRSDRLWEMYINWENDQGNLREVTSIYDRILGIPTQLYSHHFQRLLTTEQFAAAPELAASATARGREEMPCAPKTSLPRQGTCGCRPSLITEIENMRHRIIEIHQEIFNHNEHEVSKRWTFEEAVKPTFHVKPLKNISLKTGKSIRVEIENGTTRRVLKRQLAPPAVTASGGLLGTRISPVLKHLPAVAGNIDEARRILKTFEECILGLAMIRLRRVSLERRHGNMEEAEQLLEDAVRNAKSISEASFYAIKLARHLFKVQKNLPKARKVLSEAIELDKENTKLYLNLLEMEYSGDLKQNEDNILSCFDKAVHGALSIKMRITFSQRKVEFLEDFGSDVNKLLDAYDEHQALNGTEPDEKKLLTEDPSLASAQLMDGDMQVNQAAYNYNAWYQVWVQQGYNYNAWYQVWGSREYNYNAWYQVWGWV